MSMFYRPQECVNTNCTAMCCLADYEFFKGMFKDDARKCPHYQTVPMMPISVLKDIKAKIPTLAHYESPDGQDLVMVADVGMLIDKYINGEGTEMNE